jgi:hypothetical protein
MRAFFFLEGLFMAQVQSFLTVGEAASIIHRSPSMVRVYERDGNLKVAGRTAGGLRLFRLCDVEKLAVKLDEKSSKHS